MARLRQLAKLGQRNGGVWSTKPTATGLFFDEQEITRRAKLSQSRGQPKKGFSPN